MIFKKTWLSISDNTNVRWLQVFHLYKGFHRRQTYLGFFIKGSARVVEPPREEYKGFKFAFNLKGDICRGIVTRTAYPIQRMDGSVLTFRQCCSVLVKKNKTLSPSTWMVPYQQQSVGLNLNRSLSTYFSYYILWNLQTVHYN